MLVLIASALLGLAQAKPDYASPDLLIEPAELKKPAVRKKFVILDARRKAEYLVGHIPGALWVEHSAWSKGFGRDDGKAVWALRLSRLGIDADTPVVVYDAVQNKDAARIWWILRYWGVKDVRLINGGWRAYMDAGGESSKDVPEVKPTSPKLEAQPGRVATLTDLINEMKAKKTGQVLDVRSEEEHSGTKTTAKRNGAIPDARHLEWSDTIDPKTGRFKSAKELQEAFKKAGIDPKKPVTTYCQSGGRSAVMAFVVELVSGKPARNYYRSWAEWGNEDEKVTPIVVPKKK